MDDEIYVQKKKKNVLFKDLNVFGFPCVHASITLNVYYIYKIVEIILYLKHSDAYNFTISIKTRLHTEIFTTKRGWF